MDLANRARSIYPLIRLPARIGKDARPNSTIIVVARELPLSLSEGTTSYLVEAHESNALSASGELLSDVGWRSCPLRAVDAKSCPLTTTQR